MRKTVTIPLAVCLACVPLGSARAATYLCPRNKDARRVNVVRTYQVPVTRGKRNAAYVPALMSFWGATNQQIVLESRFTYSVQPDSVKVTADNLGMRRRSYELIWNAPDANAITVTQKLLVEISCQNALPTAAKLPYPEEVRERYAEQLACTKQFNSENPKVVELGKLIAKKARYAADAVELVCAWVDDNVEFKSGSPTASDTVLSSGKGNCGGMSSLACAILRSMGIPAEEVSGDFVGGGGHGYLEAYFPDAGWVFYDCSNATRGFKSLDCLMTTGWCFRVQNPAGRKWHTGRFFKATDVRAYREVEDLSPPPIHSWPKKNVQSVRVVRKKPPAKMKVRHWPISKLIMDLAIPPGKRQYVNPLAKAVPKPPKPRPTPETAPAVKPKPKPATKPAPRPAESSPAKQLRVGKMYIRGGLTAKGKAILRKLVEKYPDSKEAAEAKELLGEATAPK